MPETRITPGKTKVLTQAIEYNLDRLNCNKKNVSYLRHETNADYHSHHAHIAAQNDPYAPSRKRNEQDTHILTRHDYNNTEEIAMQRLAQWTNWITEQRHSNTYSFVHLATKTRPPRIQGKSTLHSEITTRKGISNRRQESKVDKRTSCLIRLNQPSGQHNALTTSSGTFEKSHNQVQEQFFFKIPAGWRKTLRFYLISFNRHHNSNGPKKR